MLFQYDQRVSVELAIDIDVRSTETLTDVLLTSLASVVRGEYALRIEIYCKRRTIAVRPIHDGDHARRVF